MKTCAYPVATPTPRRAGSFPAPRSWAVTYRHGDLTGHTTVWSLTLDAALDTARYMLPGCTILSCTSEES